MKILINSSSNVPIYQQIKDSFINQILNGDLKENEMIPSIRKLAQDIRISVMTIKKAYDELEEGGYIKTIHGKGSSVCTKNIELAKEQAKKEIEDNINKIIDLSRKYDIEKKEILDAFEIFYGGND